MGKLWIWTSSKHEHLLKALEPAFGRLPEVPENESVPYTEGEVLNPEPGDVCLVMGAKCLKELQHHKFVHGGRSVTGLRQKLLTSPRGGWYLVTLDPFATLTQNDAPAMVRQDVALACRMALQGSPDPTLGTYVEVQDLGDLIVEAHRRLEEDPDLYLELACDTETKGLYPEAEGAKIICIQFAIDEGKAVVLYADADGQISQFNKDCIDWLLTHDRVLLCGANWKYDSRWIRRHWGVDCTNLSRDTMIMGSMVDENRSNSLKTHAWEYTDLGGYDRLEDQGYDKSRMDLVPKEVLTLYAGADVDVTLRTSRSLKEELASSPKAARLYRKVVLPASKVFDQMEHRGVDVDLEKFALLNQELEDEIGSLEWQLLDLMPNKLKAKYSEKISSQVEAGKSPLVASLIRDYFFTPYGLNLKPKVLTPSAGEPSTAKAHLMMFSDVPEATMFIQTLEAHGSASKTKSTFVDGFLKHLRADGKLHPTYMLYVGSMFDDDDEDSGAVTGRTSCKEPAFQTIPKKTKWAKKIRACYPAPPGKCILAFDFSQGELKVVACIAEEESMLTAFRNGLDLHAVTASAFMSIGYEEFLALKVSDPFTYTLMRTGAKAGNFGLLYGMKEEGFQRYAQTVYGVIMTMSEATQRRDTFFNLYPGLLDYHEEKKAFAKKHKYVESPLGRRRNLPLVDSPLAEERSKALRQGINAPVQSCLNDLTFFALAEMHREIPQLEFFGMVHDQVLAYADADIGQELGNKAKEVMDNLPIRRTLGWDHQLQFTSDGEIGYTNMAELKRL